MGLPSPFVPLLYHTLRDLSRGFLKKFRTFFIISATRHFSGLFLCPAVSLTAPWKVSLKEIKFNGYWSAIRLCFCCPQFFVLSPPRFPSLTPLLYHNLGDLSRGFSKFFLCYSHPIGQPYARSFTSSWHHYNTTSRSRLQDGIIHKIGRNNLCIFIILFSWQIAGTVV